MSAPAITRDLAWSAAQDAANAQMRTAGRSKWSQDDYRLAVETFDRLWPEERDYTVYASLDDIERQALNDQVDRELAYRGQAKWQTGNAQERTADPPYRHVYRTDGDGRGQLVQPAAPAPVPVCRTVLCFEGEEIELKPASAIVLCRCGHPRNRHAAYSSGTSCADCDCKAYDGAPVLPEDFASPRQRLPYQYVHHVDGDPTNNDLDNLQKRTGYADTDNDPPYDFDMQVSQSFPGQPRWTCPRCGRHTIGGYCNGCGRRYKGHADVDPDPERKGRES